LSPVILVAWREGTLDERGRGFEIVRAFTPSRRSMSRSVFYEVGEGPVLAAFGGNDHNAAKHIKIAWLEAYRAAGGQRWSDQRALPAGKRGRSRLHRASA
jgi:hypothetical protein